MITADYLVIGAGAMGMAFTDVILDETDATVVIVDRRAKPGGHWNDAYPFVRLHQPSAFYGVNSSRLGSDRKDTRGGNEGLYELASGAEVLTYYDHVLNHRFLPSGRVQYFPMCELTSSEPAAAGPGSGLVGRFVSLVSGEEFEVAVTTRIVDATYMNVTVPSMRPPAYAVAPGVRCTPLNDLPRLSRPTDGYVVVGAGKTGADACLWLLGNGVDPDHITWVMPRDSWYLDRAQIQPGEFFDNTAHCFVEQLRHIAQSTSIDDVFDRLEAAGLLLRIDTAVRPTMYRCSTVTTTELAQLRRITNVVRMGHVQRIDTDRIVLDHGEIPTTPHTAHIDCSADGLARRPPRPVFDDGRITLQTVRHCQQVFSAAFIAHIEAAYDTDDDRNDLCGVVPHPDSDTDWIRTTYGNSLNSARWGADADLQNWLAHARLDGFSATTPPSDELIAVVIEFAEPAMAKLGQYIAELDSNG
ncbi:MAG: NAD(P)/FAD-dependent oxidoreductase [Ilumatobacteraceae bacterium]